MMVWRVMRWGGEPSAGMRRARTLRGEERVGSGADTRFISEDGRDGEGVCRLRRAWSFGREDEERKEGWGWESDVVFVDGTAVMSI